MTSPFEQLDRRLRRLPDPLIFALGVAAVAGIAALKVGIGHDVPVADFLLIPVVAVGWLVRRRPYAYVAAVCAAVATVIIAEVGPVAAPLAPVLVAAVARFVLYWIVLMLLGGIRTMQLACEHEARTDYLTGAANPRAFREAATAEIDRARRYGSPVSLLYLDIDSFKSINDTFGHAVGDAALEDVTHVMRCTVRTSDLVARLGGDEFAVLMPEANRFAAQAVAHRVRDELARVTVPDGRPVRCSMGVVSCVAPPRSVDDLLHDADALMYRAKQRGKDRIESVELATTAPGPSADGSADVVASG